MWPVVKVLYTVCPVWSYRTLSTATHNNPATNELESLGNVSDMPKLVVKYNGRVRKPKSWLLIFYITDSTKVPLSDDMHESWVLAVLFFAILQTGICLLSVEWALIGLANWPFSLDNWKGPSDCSHRDLWPMHNHLTCNQRAYRLARLRTSIASNQGIWKSLLVL